MQKAISVAFSCAESLKNIYMAAVRVNEFVTHLDQMMIFV